MKQETKSYVCMNKNGELEVWTAKIDLHAGFTLDPMFSVPTFPALFGKFYYDVESDFYSLSTLQQRIYAPVTGSSQAEKIVNVPLPDFWGRKVLGEL